MLGNINKCKTIKVKWESSRINIFLENIIFIVLSRDPKGIWIPFGTAILKQIDQFIITFLFYYILIILYSIIAKLISNYFFVLVVRFLIHASIDIILNIIRWGPKTK